MRSRILALASILAACDDAGVGAGASDAGPADAPAALPAVPVATLNGCSVVGAGQAPLPIQEVGPSSAQLVVPDVGAARVQGVTLTVDAQHPYPRDLTLWLVSPDGRGVLLSRRRGTGGGYRGTMFDDHATTPIATGTGAFAGLFRPEEPLGALEGAVAAGVWTLRIEDAAAGDSGVLASWSLRLDLCPAAPCVTHTAKVDPDGIPTGAAAKLTGWYPLNVDPTATVVGARLSVDLEYAFAENLELALWSPHATRVLLSRHNGGVGSDYRETVFDDRALLSIVQGQAPFTGAFRPEESFTRLGGEPAAGLWSFTAEGADTYHGIWTTENINGNAARLEVDLCEQICPAGSEVRHHDTVDEGVPGRRAARIAEGGVLRSLGVRLSLPTSREDGDEVGAPPRVVLRAPDGSARVVLDRSTAGALEGCLFTDSAERAPPLSPSIYDQRPTIGAFRPAESLQGIAASPSGTWSVEATAPSGEPAAIAEASLELCVTP